MVVKEGKRDGSSDQKAPASRDRDSQSKDLSKERRPHREDSRDSRTFRDSGRTGRDAERPRSERASDRGDRISDRRDDRRDERREERRDAKRDSGGSHSPHRGKQNGDAGKQDTKVKDKTPAKADDPELAAAKADLPPGWSAVRSKSQGKCFFYHKETATTSWTKPTADTDESIKAKGKDGAAKPSSNKRDPPTGPASGRSIPPAEPRSNSGQDSKSTGSSSTRDQTSTFFQRQPHLRQIDRVCKYTVWKVCCT